MKLSLSGGRVVTARGGGIPDDPSLNPAEDCEFSVVGEWRKTVHASAKFRCEEHKGEHHRPNESFIKAVTINEIARASIRLGPQK